MFSPHNTDDLLPEAVLLIPQATTATAPDEILPCHPPTNDVVHEEVLLFPHTIVHCIPEALFSAHHATIDDAHDAVLPDHPPITEAEPLATFVALLLVICISTAFVPRLLPHVAVLSGILANIAPVPFATIATSIFVADHVAVRESTNTVAFGEVVDCACVKKVLPAVDTVEPSGFNATIPKTPGVVVDSTTSKRFIPSLSIIASLFPSIFLKL